MDSGGDVDERQRKLDDWGVQMLGVVSWGDGGETLNKTVTIRVVRGL